MWVLAAMWGPGRNRRIMSRSGRIWISRRRKLSVLAAGHPVLEHLQAHRPVIVGRLGERLVVAFLDPGFVRSSIRERQGQPHQATSGLTRQLVAVEQHLTEQGLRLMLALLGGKAEPARAITEIIPRRPDAMQIKPGQTVFGAGVA